MKDKNNRCHHLLGETQQNRTVIYDIYCTLDDGSHVIVEMQNKKEVNFDARALYYASKSIVAQGEKGDVWRYNYTPVIGVYFMNFHQEGLGEAFRSDFGITKTRETFAHTVFVPRNTDEKASDDRHKTPFFGMLRMVFLQMPEFTKQESECTTDLDKWAYIMNHMEQLTDIPWASQDELYAELSKVSHVAALSPQERAIYDEHLKQYRDNLAALEAARLDGIEEGKKAGIEEGKKVGIEEGVQARNREIVHRMLSEGLSMAFIAQMTGLTLTDIEALQ